MDKDDLYDSSTPLSHINIYSVADQQTIPKLQNFAADKCAHQASLQWNLQQFSESIRPIYEVKPESHRRLRHIAIEEAAKHVKELIGRAEIVDLLRDHGEIACDVSKAKLRAEKVVFVKKTHRQHCPSCPECMNSCYLYVAVGWDPADCGDSTFKCMNFD